MATRSVRVPLGGPEVDVGRVAHQLLDTGHAGVLLTERPESLRAAAEADLAALLAREKTRNGLEIGSTVRVVTAVRAG